MQEIDVAKMCRTMTPIHYKNYKKDHRINEVDRRALKMYIFDLAKEKDGLFRTHFVFISKKNETESDPLKTKDSAPNKRHIKAIKDKAIEIGKFAYTGYEYNTKIKGIGELIYSTVPLSLKIFSSGFIMQDYSVFYNVKKSTFQINEPRKMVKDFVKCSFSVDFLRVQKKNGFAVITFFDKSISPQSVIYGLAREGVDILASFIVDAIKVIKGLDNLEIYILGIETENSKSGLLMKWSEMSMDIGRESYIKRIRTMKYSLDNNVFNGHDFFSLKSEKGEPSVTIVNLNPNSIKNRESNEYW